MTSSLARAPSRRPSDLVRTTIRGSRILGRYVTVSQRENEPFDEFAYYVPHWANQCYIALHSPKLLKYALLRGTTDPRFCNALCAAVEAGFSAVTSFVKAQYDGSNDDMSREDIIDFWLV